MNQPQSSKKALRRALIKPLCIVALLGLAFLGSAFLGNNSEDVTTEPEVTHRDFTPTHHTDYLYGYSTAFADMQDVQAVAASQLGVAPCASHAQLKNLCPETLVRIQDCKYYDIDTLTHSAPYLVPDAADFLQALGKLFQDYSHSNGRFIITSVTRTRQDVSNLQHGNSNATTNSCHMYGTTVDISYARIDRNGAARSEQQLISDLARALYDMKLSGYCYVKYEVHQKCFHLTVRPEPVNGVAMDTVPADSASPIVNG